VLAYCLRLITGAAAVFAHCTAVIPLRYLRTLLLICGGRRDGEFVLTCVSYCDVFHSYRRKRTEGRSVWKGYNRRNANRDGAMET
jgi:hypothetical protein